MKLNFIEKRVFLRDKSNNSRNRKKKWKQLLSTLSTNKNLDMIDIKIINMNEE